MKRVLAREKATESQWQMIDIAINAFKMRYPLIWERFLKDNRDSENVLNPYGIATDGGLKKANFRKIMSFPCAVVYDHLGERKIDSLQPVLENIIPGLTMKNSKNLIPFLKRYPMFSCSYKPNVSEF